MTKAANILAVEDSPTQAKLLRFILEENGYIVDNASNGLEALEIIKQKKPDLVITDIVMPEMDGFELCSTLKSDPALKEIPVMLLTSLSDPQDVIKGLQAGADNFLTKPYDEDFIISRVQNIFQNQELRKNMPSDVQTEILFAGHKYFINSGRTQIIDLLLSTYENAVEKNSELNKVHKDLLEIHHQLEQKNSELEKLNEEKNRFLGIAAHDLRNPLTTIYTVADLIAEDLKDKTSAETNEFLEMIKQSSRFMRGLIEELLDVSVIDSGKMSLHLEPVNIKDLIRNNVALNRIIAARKKISVGYDCEEDIPVLQLDRKKMDQVLNNLISNAIKYSYPQTKIGIVSKCENNKLVISVTDEGQGIPPEEMKKLFNSFSRISVKATSGESSTGLGLVIVRKIIEAHNGQVWAKSEIKKGSTFYVSLPI